MMKSEKGQALPLAIVTLALGTLLIAPFLGHASTSVIGSHVFADEMNYRNACDAGVEHGIWRLVYNGLGTSIPAVGNQITYSLPEAINGVTPSVTVTTNATGGGSGGTGSITKTIIDTLDFDATAGYTPDIIQVSSGIYAIAYRGTSNRGYLKTVSIATDGTIGNSAISTLIFDSTAGYEPKIIRVTGNYYAITYRGSGNHGFVKTVSITSGGTIGGSVVSSLDFANACYTPSIVPVSGIYYAIAYRGNTNKGYVITVSISSSGIIGGSVISSLTLDNSTCYEPDIIYVTGNYYAIAYRGASNRGNLKTISITAAGAIGGSVISTLIFDTSASYEPSIIPVTSTIYAIAYRSGDGSLITVSIAANGIIGSSVISTLVFDTANSYLPDIIQVASNTFAIAYGNSTNKGYLKTVSITSGGVIGTPVIDTFNFDTATGYEPSILYVSGNVFTIAYRGAGTDGFIITVGITTGSGVNKYRIDATAGDTTITAYVTINLTTASITSWEIK